MKSAPRDIPSPSPFFSYLHKRGQVNDLTVQRSTKVVDSIDDSIVFSNQVKEPAAKR